MQNAPKPTDTRVRIIDLPTQYFGVISILASRQKATLRGTIKNCARFY